MTNKQIVRQVEAFRASRKGWFTILNNRPDSVEAAQMILSINHKIEFLLTLWNWSDETVDFPWKA